ncbi:Clp protease N-terminal domain-containing protein [Actinoplanes sp. N902-109]|uniref:Clp protease N-terminal domain-containing protein n=1 Tax=Actinoplanes sp. (strain N902-109) TaxID=649831 RepID=UPI0003294FD5|nr:Clp protease N-terminal domain-containing protein [Actinoplanes sp. N902-109]AGL19448.1 endopeptidase Clp [Actinoplanes sp. N902-109]
MPKINVYLPDELADSVREAGLPVSAICQYALQQALRRVASLRKSLSAPLEPGRLAEQFPQLTGRAVTVLTLAAERARQRGDAPVTTGDLLHGLIAEGSNLGLQVLGAMDVDTAAISAPDNAEPAGPGGGDGLRFSAPAIAAIELAVLEAVGLSHNYVGCEHLLIGLSAEPDGAAGAVLRELGADGRATKRAVAAAVAGYAHLRANTAQPAAATGLLTAVRAELAPLVQRIEALESRIN